MPDTNERDGGSGGIARLNRRNFMQATGGLGVAGIAGYSGTVGAQDEPHIELEAVSIDEGYPNPESREACMNGGWEEYGFRNQGQCIRYVNTGKDSRDDNGDETHFAWRGVAPEEIADLENPTLVLVAGESYTLTWTNTDGHRHTFAIEDADGETVLESEGTDEEGETEIVEFTASEEMTHYYCSAHPEQMRGDIEVGAPAVFAVSDLEPSEITVEQGEPFDVSATVTNTGDEVGEQWIELNLDDEMKMEQSLALEPGDAETVSFEDVETDDLEGTYELTISSEDEWVEGTLTVEVDEVDDEVNVLVFSVTDGFRHGVIPFANEQIEAIADDIAVETGAAEVTIDVIDDPDGDASAFPDDPDELAQYDTIVWNSTTGSPLNSSQQAAFETYIRSGGGYAGIHAASDTHYDWEWYGDLVGAYFEGHPPGTHDVQVNVEDRVHPSTDHLPAAWWVHDEPYDFQINPRGDVHVLATFEEDSYEGASMTDGRVDHPMAWCHDYDGGRAWYTALGHTEETFEQDGFLEHVLYGILWSGGFVEGDASATVWDSWERVEIATDIEEGPMSMTFTPDGRIFFVNRFADVHVVDPDTHEVSTALAREFYSGHEDGGLGIAVDPDFEETGWMYVYYSPEADELDPDDDMPYNLLSRFDVVGDELDPDTEVEILRVHQQRESCCHSGGELQFGPDGELFLSTGDNVTPHDSDGFAPIDETSTDPNTADAQGTSGDSSDLRGNILRIVPHEDGSYSIPEDNLYTEEGGWEDEIEQGLVRPEIFAQGFRNPFRYGVDQETGWVYVADYGPDSTSWDADRGPIGIREYNQIREAGHYGWPFTRGPNYPYIDYDFATGESHGPFDPDGPINDSPNNDGLEELPPVEPATFYVTTNWDNYLNAPSPDEHDWGDVWDVPDQVPYPEVTDRAPNGGPLVRIGGDRADTALPPYFHGKWFVGEWNSGNFLVVSFDDDDELLEISPFLPDLDLSSPHTMEVGPDGRFYYIDYDGWEGPNPGIYRLDYLPEVVGTLSLSLSLADTTLPQGGSTTATTTVTNTTDEAVTDVEVTVGVDGDVVTVEALDETSAGTLAAGESLTLEWEVTVDEEAGSGEYALLAEATYVDAEGEDQQLTQAATATVEAPELLTAPWGVDAGGPPQDVEPQSDVPVVVDGLEFVSGDDVDAIGGVTVTGDDPGEEWFTPPAMTSEADTTIENTEHDALYQTELHGYNLGFEIALQNGTYDVVLHNAEIWWGEDGLNPDGAGGEGSRVFDIAVQGDTVAEEFDIYAAAGGSNVAHTLVVEDAEVEDELLTIETTSHENFSKFAAIEIRRSGDPIEEDFFPPGTTIELEGETNGWLGVVPEEIEGVENPTLTLAAGEEYTVEWTNADGIFHNFVIEDEDGETILQSDGVSDEGETEVVEFVATEEMAEYYCLPHPQYMRGVIDVVD